MNPYPEAWNYQMRPCGTCGQPARWDRTWDRDTLGKDRVDDPICDKCRAARAFDDAVEQAEREAAERIRQIEAAFDDTPLKARYTTGELGLKYGHFPYCVQVGRFFHRAVQRHQQDLGPGVTRSQHHPAHL